MIDPDDTEFKDIMKKTLTKFWSRLWNQPFLVRYKFLGTGKPVANAKSTLADQNTHALWKPTNLRESASEKFNQKIMRIALWRRDSIR